MKFLVCISQLLVGDVRVDLCRCNGSMPEHGLDGSNISAIEEQVRRKCVPERMRRNVFSNARQLGVFFYDSLNTSGGQSWLMLDYIFFCSLLCSLI